MFINNYGACLLQMGSSQNQMEGDIKSLAPEFIARRQETLHKEEEQFDVSAQQLQKGSELLRGDDPHGALREFRSALAIRRQLAASQTEANRHYHGAHAFALMRTGEAWEALDDSSSAMAAYTEAAGIFDQQARSCTVLIAIQRNVSAVHERLADLHLKQGDLDGALREYREVLASDARLAVTEPMNAAWLRDMATCHVNMGKAHCDRGDAALGVKHFREAIALDKRATAIDPTNLQWQRDVLLGHGAGVGDK